MRAGGPGFYEDEDEDEDEDDDDGVILALLQVALRVVVLHPGGLSAGRGDWLVVSTILPQAPGPKWG
jgi:hypothetical protein